MVAPGALFIIPALLLASLMSWPAAAQESCVPAIVAGTQGSAELENARRQVAALRAEWAAGTFRGINRASGTSTTNGATETALRRQAQDISDFAVLGDDAVAFAGATSVSGRHIKQNIARAQASNNAAALSRAREALATWQKSVDKKRDAMEQRRARLEEVMRDLREAYESRIAAIEAEVNADIDDTAGLPACGYEPGDAIEQAGSSPPIIETLDERIAACLADTGDGRDLCLANLVLAHESPAPCNAAPGGRCAEFVGTFLMGQCEASVPGDRLLECEMQAADWIGLPGSCAAASDPVRCYALIAARQKAPSILSEFIDDPIDFAIAIQSYVLESEDVGALEEIESNHLHDKSVIYVSSMLAIRNSRRLPGDFCNTWLRGDYEYPWNEDEAVDRDLCDDMVRLTNWTNERFTRETDPETMRAMIEEFRAGIAAIENGDATLEQWIGSMSDAER